MKRKFYIWDIVIYSLRTSIGWNYLLSFALCILFLLIFNVKNITYQYFISISEFYLELIGIVLFTGIGFKEQKDNMEIFRITKFPYIFTILMKIAFAIFYVIICVLFILICVKLNGGDAGIIQSGVGLTFSIVLVGFFGLLITNITHDMRVGYIASIGYYLLEYKTKGLYTKSFFLYGILENRRSSIFGSIILLLVLLFLICYFANKRE